MHGSLYLEYLGLPHPPVGRHFVKDTSSSDSHRSRQDSPPYIMSMLVLTTRHCDHVFVSLSHVLDSELLKMRPDLTPLWFPSCQPVPQYQFAKEENKAMLSSLNVSFLSRFCLFFTTEVREVNLSHLWSLPRPAPHQPQFLTHGLLAFAVSFIPAQFLSCSLVYPGPGCSFLALWRLPLCLSPD